jgi:hypothetical protein
VSDVDLALRLLDELEAWCIDARACLLWTCTHCGARVDEPCLRPDGALWLGLYPTGEEQRYHAPRRQNLHVTRLAADTIRALRRDLSEGRAPDRVVTTLHRDRLYRRLVQLGKLTPPLVRVAL